MKRTAFLLVLFFVFSALAFGAERELFREAEGRYQSGNYAAALDLYTRFISENRISTNIPNAEFKSAVCLYQLERYEDALERFNLVRNNYKNTDYIEIVPFWQGRTSLELKNYSMAADYFDEYISSAAEPLISEAYLYRAMCFKQLGRIDDVIFSLEILSKRSDYADNGYLPALLMSSYLKQEKYNDIVTYSEEVDEDSLAPEYSERVKLYEAEAFYKIDNLDKASEIYSELKDSDSSVSGPAWQRLFSIYHKTGRDSELPALLLEAEKKLKSNPEILADFRMRIGVASYLADDYDTAERYLLAVWDAMAPQDMSAIVPLYYSKILERNDRLYRAEEILEVFLANSTDMKAKILVRLAELYTKSGNYAAADSKLNIYFAEFEDSPIRTDAAYLKSYICYQQSKYEEALEYSKQAYNSDEGGERTIALLRLESTLLKKLGRYQKAADKLLLYLGYQPNDVDARLDLLRLNFLMKNYNKILTDSVDFKWILDSMGEEQDVYLLCSYITGLSAIAVSDYSRAVTELSSITLVNTEEAGLTEIYPYALFYKGWALYRAADYQDAASDFDELINDFPSSESAAEAAYLAGWCEYINGDYEKSSSYFVKYTMLSDDEERGNFMYAKSLAEQKRYSEAVNIFAEIPRKNPESLLADDALFEKAALNALMGNIEQAAADYEYLYKKMGGKLAEEGMFRRGELFYSSEDYISAAAAYSEFRQKYPESSLYDAALYWGGMAQYQSEEYFGAALLWESLIKNYRDSVFRAPAIVKTASVYKDSGDYSKALELYEKCRLEYPDTDKAADAALESEKIRLLMSGLSEKEADLNVVITTEGGSESSKGRRAMVELSALYISIGGEDVKPALSMLNQVLSYKDKDPEAAADAQFYIGENLYRQNKYKDAVQSFLSAAEINPSDKDSTARALYRAADAAVLAGSRDDAKKLIKRLKNYYPGSSWSFEADKLLKEGR
ncbi:MAG: tetratricopeptide repeat protein [Spirochaetales bacterium]|nr:tetratricopeptide repeat protein [Spirochaetales bacterium]